MSAKFYDSLQAVSNIAAKFQAGESYYLSPKYQESEVRQQFIDKFWVALGWDVYHQENINPYEREVRIEKRVSVDGRGKRADYAFYTSPNFAQARFMVEAKKPSRNLENTHDCFQAVRYGWNSNTPLAVLTDFEQFFILDSRYKPNIETSTESILKRFHYTEFTDEEKFGEIYFLFSREEVLNDSLEKYAKNLGKSKGARQTKLFNTSIIQPIDEEFLKELDSQRVSLASAFKNNNEYLDSETLTEITQRTLDRLVFLRFLEDKLVESDPVIDNLGTRSGSAWRDFINQMPRLNKVYNGTLFKKHELLDSPNFAPDEYAFAQTRDWLAHVNSPYDFNSIPIHILGSIYERFLGKTIEVTATRAMVVDKPEVRKAGGVYYTPEYIVSYIVENTIGNLIKTKTPEETSQMRFADIACGSGSFLLGVFDYLIAYHVEYYGRTKKLREQAIKQGIARETSEGSLQLTIHFKREILTNNIYGVDLDAQAVEVAQLSLYLKLLEEETTSTKQQYLTGYREQLLPPLNKNIIHGNSLVGKNIENGILFDFKELKKMNPMNFQSVFSDIFQNGGFDAIVGNPPYGAELTEEVRLYLKKEFNVGTTDTAALMMLQSMKITRKESRIGLIVPKSFTYSSTWDKTRNSLANDLEILVDTGKVWKEVKLEQVICLFNKSFQKISKYKSLKRNKEDFNFLAEIPKKEVEKFGFYLNGLTSDEIFIGRKIYNLGTFLGDVVKNSRGGMFQKQIVAELSDTEVIGGKQINRLFVNGRKGFVKSKKFLPLNSFVYPGDIIIQNIVAHIMNPVEHIKIIGAVVDSSHSDIVILDTVNRLSNHSEMSSYYLLALLHSKLVNWYVYRFIFAKAIRTMHFDAPVSDKLPIPVIDFSNSKEKYAHDKIVELVEKMIETKKLLAAAQTDKDKTFYERYCESLDSQIDGIVFDLYGLSGDEREVVG